MIKLLLVLIPLLLTFFPGFIRYLDGKIVDDSHDMSSAMALESGDGTERLSLNGVRQGPPETGDKHFTNGPFDMAVREAKPGTSYSVVVKRNEKVLFKGESFYSMPETETMADFPRKGCNTLLAYTFSGGAHCCTAGILCTECEGSGNLTIVDLSNLEEFIPTDPDAGYGGGIGLIDYQFAYYETKNPKLWFPFSISPAMERLLVFKDGKWNVDKPGEKPGYYEKLLDQKKCGITSKLQNQASDEDDLDLAATAIECSYYDLMAGKGADTAAAMLANKLPDSWKSEAAGIFRDVRKAVSNFDPVKRLYQSP